MYSLFPPSPPPLPHAVFVHNHASPDDFQPYSLKQMHSHLAHTFVNSPLKIASELPHPPRHLQA